MLASASTWLQHHLLQLHGPLVYVVPVALVFFELAIAVGFFVPGEIAAVVGGVIASQHRASAVLMVVFVVVAATVGNLVGYELGRVIGPWLLAHRPLKGHRGVAKAQDLLSRRGGWAVLIGRWIAVVRALVPGVAGVIGMDRRVFGIFSLAGGIGWGTMWVLIGYAAGLSYVTILNDAGQWSLVALGAVVVLVATGFVWLRARERRQ